MTSRTRLTIWFVAGIVAVSGLGNLAGKRLAVWRADRTHDAAVAKLERGEASDLHVGQTLPEVHLVSPDGRGTTTSALVQDQDALIVFVSPGCEACTEAVLRWQPDLEGDRPGHPRILGIARGKAEDVNIYVRETGLTLPLFADESDVFGSRYELHPVPTVIGIQAGGRIVFIRHGISESFTPSAAEELLAKAR